MHSLSQNVYGTSSVINTPWMMDCWWIAWLRLAASYFLRDWLKQQSVGFKGKRKKNLKRQQQLLRGFIFTWSVVSAGRNLFRPQFRPDTIQTLALDEEKKQNKTTLTIPIKLQTFPPSTNTWGDVNRWADYMVTWLPDIQWKPVHLSGFPIM